MNFRQRVFFFLSTLRGKRIGKYYHHYLSQVENGIAADTSQKLLSALFDHCKHNVPYYAAIMAKDGQAYEADPIEYLKRFPILTRHGLRQHYEELKSIDLHKRRWYKSSSGGSTGMPAEFILDREYEARSVALTLLYSKLVGKELGEREVQLWGSTRDILNTRQSLSGSAAVKLANICSLNIFRMTSEQMEQYLAILNQQKPKLILAYAYPLYELVKYAEGYKLAILPQRAIMTSAGTLYPFMRETIERAFQCKVYSRYGCREVGDIACERPGVEGFWVAPWGSYVEIVDEQGNPVPDGQEGNILLTCLINYAMPLIRYDIMDRGYLLPKEKIPQRIGGQVLGDVTGRSLESFRKRDGTVITPNYFSKLLYYREWIDKFQVVQKDYEHVEYKFLKTKSDYHPDELDEIKSGTQLVMGKECTVDIKFVDEIPCSDSGKYRFYISEINQDEYQN